MFSQYAALRPRTKSANRHPRSTFLPDEDFRLRELVRHFGTDWNEISRHMTRRNPRQCKERWTNYLSPDVCLRPWREDEDQLLLRKVGELGPKWVQITSFFPKRTDSNLKNRWFILMRLARKVAQQTLDAETQMPAFDVNPDLAVVENSTFEISGLLNPTMLDTPVAEKPQQWDLLDWL
jgi:hypothetical protein